MAEHREPYDLRESRTVLGAHGVRFPRATRQMVVRIAGKRIYLWRAVDHEGEIHDATIPLLSNPGLRRRPVH